MAHVLSQLPALIVSAGYAGLFAAIFAESGLFFGFFLPGDSLLFTAGLLAARGYFNIDILVPLFALAAILGDSAGYWFGAHAGPKLFSRDDSLFFRKKHLKRTSEFFAEYGARAVILARFIPIARTFAPILAGAGSMTYRKFLIYNIIGGLFWSLGLLLPGYFLGAVFPALGHYLLFITFAIVFFSLIPAGRELVRTRRRQDSRFALPDSAAYAGAPAVEALGMEAAEEMIAEREVLSGESFDGNSNENVEPFPSPSD